MEGDTKEKMREGVESCQRVIMIATPRYKERSQMSETGVHVEMTNILSKMKDHKHSVFPLLVHSSLPPSETEFWKHVSFSHVIDTHNIMIYVTLLIYET
jgi:hypothetical protein